MNSRLEAALGAAALFAACAGTGRAADPIIAFPERSGNASGAAVLYAKGTPRAVVLASLGAPDAILSRDAWVYWNFQTSQPQRTAGFDTLVIVFDADRVARLRIVDGAAVRRFLAAREKRPGALLQQPLFTAQPPARR